MEELRGRTPSNSPVLIEGRIVSVSPDRGWVNLPADEVGENGVDSREVDFDSSEAAFRTILVEVDVESVLRGGGRVSARNRNRAADGDSLQLTLVLFNGTTFESAEAELKELDDVIVPVVEVHRGSFGQVLEPYGGSDMIVDVIEGDKLEMPFADPEIEEAVLGDTRSRSQLKKEMAAS